MCADVTHGRTGQPFRLLVKGCHEKEFETELRVDELIEDIHPSLLTAASRTSLILVATDLKP
ncbi:hypothetical protein Msi02_00050 [Microbispora siamensis]|uniref:Uncharacterized protein n=1 Tax=Microbispora siamensis TaxID=564413 RepID=A0ABQ4GCS3_9ACTN|nr:hypothetical protein [Microbispora sp. GKU 823]GIH59188.1 hypothetical protein Msi02_00050 [Microbispora siamensis]